MEAGKLRHKITIQKLDKSRNSLGEPKQIWNTVLTPRASKEPLLGNEFFQAEAVQSKVEVKFRLRYTSLINGTMRVVHNGETYEILGEPVNVQGLNRELLLYCRRVVV